MSEEIKNAIDQIRPLLQADGGDIEFISFEDGIVKVRLTGACSGCPMSQITLKKGVEQKLKELVPGVESVESV